MLIRFILALLLSFVASVPVLAQYRPGPLVIPQGTPGNYDILYWDNSAKQWYRFANPGAGTKVLTWNGSQLTWATGGGGSGTVTSVALALPAEFSISGSPVTTSGTLTGAWANESANTVFAGPTGGGATTPGFRALVAADIPNLNTSILTAGTLGISRGGTNNGSLGVSTLALVTGDGSKLVQTPNGSALQSFRVNAGGTAIEPYTPTTGTVTSVAATVPTEMTIGGSPVTTTGTLAFGWGSASGRKFIASPSDGSSGAYSGRAIVAADIPALTYAAQGANGDITSMTALSGSLEAPTQISSGGLECLKFTYTASAVNEITLASAATGNAPNFSASGNDSNISIALTPKGTGIVQVGASNANASIAVGSTTLTSNTGATARSFTLPAFGGSNTIVGCSTFTNGAVYVANGTNGAATFSYAMRGDSTAITASSTTLTNTSNPVQILDGTSNTVTVTLPAATNKMWFFFIAKNATNTLTLQRGGSDTITNLTANTTGNTSVTMAVSTSFFAVSDGSSIWYIR